MRSPNQHQRGYSLTELLVVISLIGVLSLVVVPSFMSLMNTNRMAATTRQFATDVRSARGRAVSSGRPTKISFVPASAPCTVAEPPCSARSYSLFDCTAIDATGKVSCTATPVWTHAIDNTAYFDTSTNFTDVDTTANSDVDIVFQTNGTLPSSAPAAPIVVVRSGKKIRFNEADFRVNVAGTVSTTKTSF
jgi:prepilin-type N-terminal cleavage/methylation domain-containing protein